MANFGWMCCMGGLLFAVSFFDIAEANDCEAQCGSAYCGATDEAGAWKCDDDRRSCIANCLNDQNSNSGASTGSHGAPRAPQYGAIAYSGATGGYGYSYNYGNSNAAESTALGYCEQDSNHAGDCRVLITFYDNCGALARASDGTFGAGWGNGQQGAGASALEVCARYGGRDCQIIQTVCNGG